MSRLKGFAAYEGINESTVLSPALQLLCKEHAKLRRGMDSVWQFAMKASKHAEPAAVEEWIEKEKKLRADWDHHFLKEERALLSLLTKYVESDRGPLAVMRYEHERLEALFDEMEKMLQALLASPTDEQVWNEALALLRNLYQVKSDHCYKEEKTIFTLAQSLLTDAEKIQLLQVLRKMK